MLPAFRFYSTVFFLGCLTACGGSSDSGSSNPGPSNNSSSEIIRQANNYGPVKLANAADALVEERYIGKRELMPLNIAESQKLFQLLFDDGLGGLPDLALNHFSENLSSNLKIDKKVNCDVSGSVTFKGQFEENYTGTVAASYVNCLNYSADSAVSGNAAFSIVEYSQNDEVVEFYFDNLNWTTDKGQQSLTGVMNTGISDSGSKIIVKQKLLYSIGNIQQYVVDTTSTETTNGVPYFKSEVTGSLLTSDKGRVNITTTDIGRSYYYEAPSFSQGKITFTGDRRVQFDFGDNLIKYLEDTDGDNSYDVGTYFGNIEELINGSVLDKTLVALTDMSLPPVVNAPYFLNSYADTRTPIEVYAGYYRDEDTATEDLVVSYRWYINGVLVEGEHSSLFPAYLAVYGDVVSVSMVVADQTNSIESETKSITLSDSPSELIVSNIPEQIQAGTRINFSVRLTDPDMKEEDQFGVLISGPRGASMDQNGEVSWDVPSDLVFSTQFFTFTVGLPNLTGEIAETRTIEVEVTSDKELPIVRSGLLAPRLEHSILVSDFDQNGTSEILTTDNYKALFILSEVDGTLQQKWMYPYSLPTDGNIIQIASYDSNNDGKQEIFIATEHGISVIHELTQNATKLFSTEKYIRSIAIADVDHDGRPEIAYLYSNSEYEYSDDGQVKVVQFDTPDTVEFVIDMLGAKQIIFANVDNDSNLELISNSGLVYDSETWTNQWLSGTEFGRRFVTTGDYNGDGISEIAGAGSWGDISIFSAQSKSTLATIENQEICTLVSGNIDSDPQDELVAGDCQWGDINAYDLENGQLVSQWEVGMQGHGSASLAIGDSDNDDQLEIHWGSGLTSSGQDYFVTADVDEGVVIVKNNESSVQATSYSTAGWSKITEEKERAIFFVPETKAGMDSGSRVVEMDSTGSLTFSELISTNWDGSRYAITSDFNNDGFGDIFLPATSYYDGEVAVMQLFDYSTHWSLSSQTSSDIGVIKAFDLNQDGFDDLNYIDGRQFKVIDIENELEIAKYTFDDYPQDFTSLYLDHSISIVAHGDKLSLMTVLGGAFFEQSSLEQSCLRLEMFNYDTDDALELLCLNSSSHWSVSGTKNEIVIYEIESNNLVEQARHELAYKALDVAVDVSSSTKQSLFIAGQIGDDYSYWNDNNIYFVGKVSNEGFPIWKSAALIGKPAQHGLKVRNHGEQGIQMMISTSNSMYLLN
ncbi:FG-GAP repeat domain-containing protein [Shewanella gelidii]|uniref:VCBS repeat-containing protein n=1 Tax=Shewanella gelidii TaxID=1642821 RepID=A0A917JLT9_9GAMM|nr:VCBS repeat-containing protein [Shewanella gelidii]MCL1096974.1 VCBS repeat-containing protein [Shewanella gelidii]GGI71618.1 hypothetical protein GCM10009332_06210 [Shewanella gelidii]